MKYKDHVRGLTGRVQESLMNQGGPYLFFVKCNMYLVLLIVTNSKPFKAIN